MQADESVKSTQALQAALDKINKELEMFLHLAESTNLWHQERWVLVSKELWISIPSALCKHGKPSLYLPAFILVRVWHLQRSCNRWDETLIKHIIHSNTNMSLTKASTTGVKCSEVCTGLLRYRFTLRVHAQCMMRTKCPFHTHAYCRRYCAALKKED